MKVQLLLALDSDRTSGSFDLAARVFSCRRCCSRRMGLPLFPSRVHALSVSRVVGAMVWLEPIFTRFLSFFSFDIVAVDYPLGEGGFGKQA